MNKLPDLAVGRDNNFNLIRLTAALAVLIAHCIPLATGREANFRLGHYLGISLGTVAVDIFFITSGFLVTGSLLTNRNTIKFISARILRIYPALLVMLLLTTTILGTYFTHLQWADYLTSKETASYILKNSTLFTGVSLTLPGVFETNPHKGAVNGSLWTMPYEVWMYGALIFIWLAPRVIPRFRLRMFKAAIIALATSSLAAYIAMEPYGHSYYQPVRLFSMFFVGASYCVLRDRLRLTPAIFWLAVSALTISTLDKHVFHITYGLTLAYLLIYAAYVPAGRIRSFNQMGDYSYGIYIYAFPVQQSVAALLPGISIEGMLLTSLSATVALASLSWHLVEKPALAMKSVLASRPIC
jgi:peptidoglycan/LPS O-acetylase OafA/YrhL